MTNFEKKFVTPITTVPGMPVWAYMKVMLMPTGEIMINQGDNLSTCGWVQELPKDYLYRRPLPEESRVLGDEESPVAYEIQSALRGVNPWVQTVRDVQCLAVAIIGPNDPDDDEEKQVATLRWDGTHTPSTEDVLRWYTGVNEPAMSAELRWLPLPYEDYGDIFVLGNRYSYDLVGTSRGTYALSYTRPDGEVEWDDQHKCLYVEYQLDGPTREPNGRLIDTWGMDQE